MSNDGHIYEIVTPDGEVLESYFGTNEQHVIKQLHHCRDQWKRQRTAKRYWEEMTGNGWSIRKQSA